MTHIRANYDELRAAAQLVAAESEAARRCIRALATRATQLMAGWDGVAEQEFMRQLQSCASRMARTPAMLDELAGDMREAARVLEQGERDASALIAATVTADG